MAMNTILLSMLPVIVASICGFLLSRTRAIDLGTLGNIVIYCIAPIVNFDAVLKAQATPAMVALPVCAFLLGALNSMLTYQWAWRLRHGLGLIVASSASSANTLYFGLGLAAAVLPPALLPAFLLTCVGFSLSETIFGYYFLARRHFTWRLAIRRVTRLPVLYAVALGLLCHVLRINRPDWLEPLAMDARGTLILLGSMILGVALGQEKSWRFQPGLAIAVLMSRHVSFAALACALLYLDRLGARWIEPQYDIIFVLFALFPIANNTLTFAATLNVPTGAISNAIVLSNLVALGFAALFCNLHPAF
jgi:predicted permease